MYLYIKALHIIFMVTWFAGLFYIVRLFIYNTEANEKSEVEKKILQAQLNIMMRRLWYGITWPSAILTLILGPWIMFQGNWHKNLDSAAGQWLLIKLIFVFLLYIYHLTLHRIFKQQLRSIHKYTSQQLRIWNELATIFLIAIVMLASVKQSISIIWGLAGLVIFIFILLTAINIYKRVRKN